MTPVKVNYEIYDKELLAIMWALDKWRHYLMGTDEPFEIWTDHKNLEYFRKPQRLNGRQARWYQELQNYNFKLHHIPGMANCKADILSRLPWYKDEIPKPADTTMLKEQAFIKHLTLLEDKQFRGGGTNTTKITKIAKSTVEVTLKTLLQ